VFDTVAADRPQAGWGVVGPAVLAAFWLLLLFPGNSTAGDSSRVHLDERHQRTGDQAAADIRAAFQTDLTEQRNALADQAMKRLDTLIADPEASEFTIRRSRFDYILALRVRERMLEATEAYDQLLTHGYKPPAYVTEAAADAWLHQGRPDRAAVLYRQVLADDPSSHNTRVALFYALNEQENHQAAFEVIDELVADTADDPGSWPWIEARTIAAMARAYANQLSEAEQRLESALIEAPGNARLLRDLATVQRWRGLPGRALASIETARQDAPDHVAVRLQRANILADLGHFSEADAQLQALSLENPENIHVQRDLDAWQQRRRWAINLHGEYGESSGSAIAQFGSRDRSGGLRLNAPWLGENLQPYFLYDYSDATFPEGQADYDRAGAGLSWRQQRRHAYLEWHRNRTGQADNGIVAGFEWHHDDHWSFASRYESFSTDVPLRARGQGLDGWKVEVGARWQAHESLGVRINLSRLDISDGNVRWAGLVAVPHRLHASARHITQGSADLYGSRASQTGGPYFNPKRDSSLTYSIEHDWLTWRHYQQSFSQVFMLAGGGYWQDSFGTHAIGLARYDHVWRFNSRWGLRYGIGVSSRVYDGDRERHLDGRFMLEGAF